MLLSASARADALNMPVGVSETSRIVYDLHMLILWICVVIGIGVFGVILWSIIHHRKSAGHQPASFHENTRLEIVWTLIPVLILIGMAWPATTTLIDMYDTGGEDMTVEVRGYQWRWQYKYLDEDLNSQFSFFSNLATPAEEIQGQAAKGQYYLLEVDNPLRIPVDRKVRFLLTAEDVIHAWWVPDFGMKKDAIPGMLNEMWTRVDEPGIYRGQCAELCGKDHAFMPVVVQAMPQEEFDAWYAEQLQAAKAREEALSKTFTEQELMAEGQKVYNSFCSSCHQPNGQGMPPVFPAIAGSPVATGPKEDHIDIVLNGVPGTAMQAFGRQLDAAQIAAVVHYERHAFGNNTGDTTQPADVVARQQAQQ
ncbi:MAG TPA: cytochrome c oxidase subunit II [Pseudomonadales bacterium]